MSIEIRAATSADADAVASLNADVQAIHAAAVPWLFKDQALGAAQVERLLEKPDNFVLLACAGSESVGYVFAELRRFPETPLTHAYQALHVHHISVLEAFRKAGVGRALMDALRNTGEDIGVARITADVWSFNDGARRFFASCGLSPYIERLWS
ncbi:MAG: GNAT family N-acetyltransferase [Methyloligellaceae bacterium]